MAALKEASKGVYEGEKERRKQSIEPKFRGDALNIESIPQVKQMVETSSGTKVQISATVQKLNRRYKFQERILCMSDTGIFNVGKAPKYVQKRFFPFADIEMLQMSKLCDSYVVLKVKNSVDWVCIVPNKTEFVTLLRDSYKRSMKKDLQQKFSNEIVSTLAKGPITIVFEKGEPESFKKVKNTLKVTVSSAELASDKDWEGIVGDERQKQLEEWRKNRPKEEDDDDD